MAYREYEIIVRNCDGSESFFLQGEYEVRWALRLNSVSVLTLELPGGNCQGEFSINDFGEDFRIELYRSVLGQDAIDKELVGCSPFFISFMEDRIESDGSRVIYIEAENGIGILGRRVNAYRSNRNAAELNPRQSDDQMKYVVANNSLPFAIPSGGGSFSTPVESYISTPAIDPLRDLSNVLNVAPITTTSAVTYEGQNAHQFVLSTIKRIAEHSFENGEPIFFDICQTDPFANPYLEFQTYVGVRGTDRTQATLGALAVIVTDDNGTISERRQTFDWRDTANRIYAGGVGKGNARPFEEAQEDGLVDKINNCPVSLRERYFNANSDEAINIQNEAQTELQRHLSRVQISGQLGETRSYTYGMDYNFGDLITASVNGLYQDVFIDAEEGQLQGGAETLSVSFSTDLNRTAQTVLQSVYRDINRLNINLEYLNAIERI